CIKHPLRIFLLAELNDLIEGVQRIVERASLPVNVPEIEQRVMNHISAHLRIRRLLADLQPTSDMIDRFVVVVQLSVDQAKMYVIARYIQGVVSLFSQPDGLLLVNERGLLHSKLGKVPGRSGI